MKPAQRILAIGELLARYAAVEQEATSRRSPFSLPERVDGPAPAGSFPETLEVSVCVEDARARLSA